MSINNDDEPKLDHLISEFEKINDENQLNECTKKLGNSIQILALTRPISRTLTLEEKIERTGPNSQKKCAVNIDNKFEIQAYYKYQEHRALQEIIFGQSIYCQIDKKTIENRYTKLLSKVSEECKISMLSSDLWPKDGVTEKNNLELNKLFTRLEVRSKLNAKIYCKLSNSRSVGIDNLKYIHLKRYDPNSAALTELFNACLKIQTVPKIWKEMYSVLVKIKEGQEEEITHWRTVSMHNTISKLFQTLLACKLIVWAKETKRLSPTQKGYLLSNAACESSFILQEIKSYAYKNKKELAVAWLDFSDASDFISQEAILYALQQHAVPSSFINLIKNFLKDIKTCVRCNGGYTKIIPVNGIPQGSPLAPILIDLLIEPILRKLALDSENTFEIFNKKINHVVIPSEIVLISESKEKLQNLLDTVEEISKLIGLRFKIVNCATYHCDVNHSSQNSKFEFFGQKLQALKDEKIKEYFGVRQGLSIGQSGSPSIEEMLDAVDRINESKLLEYQKLDAVYNFILPRAENCLRGIQEIDEIFVEKINKAEKFLIDKIKIWLDMDKDASIASVVFQATKLLRKNDKFLPFLDLFYVMKIVQAYKMLTSEDILVKELAIDSIKNEISEIIKDKNVEVTMKHITEYLSGILPVENKTAQCLRDWSIVREATVKLQIKINLNWIFEDDHLQISVKGRQEKKNVLLKDNIRFNVVSTLKNKLHSYYMLEVKKNISETKRKPKTKKGSPKTKKSVPKTLKNSPEIKKNESEASKKNSKPMKPKKFRKRVRKAHHTEQQQLPFLHSSNFPVLAK